MKKLLFYTEKLKHLPRTGWLRHEIEAPETVASHCWQMAIMALQLSEKYNDKYDFNKVLKLCLIHDLGESVIGDITPFDKNYHTKKKIEIEAVERLAHETDFSLMQTLFCEYEDNQTPEANLAHDLDKIDMYAQMLDYQQKYPNKDLSEFRDSVYKHLLTPLGKALFDELDK